MPLIVSCEDLQPGMRLAEPFLFRGRRMLPAGKLLAGEDIDILCRKYPDAMLKIGDPVLDSVVSFDDDAADRDVASTATQQISAAMSDVQKKFSNHTNLSGIDFVGLQHTVAAVMEYLKANPVSAALLTPNANDQSYLAEHAGNVFYLSMVLGSAVKDYVVKERQRQTAASHLSHALAMDLLPLGLGSMFLDIGMQRLGHVFQPGYTLTDADRRAIFEHPAVGADMLPESVPAATRMIVRWHHENFDGTGYPDKRPAARLHVFVRIARICDAFDAATSNKLYKQVKSPVRALWEMSCGPYRRFYDPVLMKVFMSILQPFPIGGKLTLVDGRGAVVVRYNKNSPFRPTVVVAFDERGARLPAEQLIGPINVGDGNDLRLARFGQEEMDYLYDESGPEAAAGDSTQFVELIEAVFP